MDSLAGEGEKYVVDLVSKVLKVNPDEKASTRKSNQVRQMAQDIRTDINQHGDNLWGLFNGITRYTNHSQVKSEKSLENVMVGAFAKTGSVREAKEIAASAIELVGLAGLESVVSSNLTLGYRKRLEVAREEMLRGSGFSGPLAATNLFPGAAKQMFKVGEETGTLDEQLAAASEYFDSELEVRIKRFTTMFEPIMIIGVGLMVGFVAVALVSAMYGVLGGVKDGA